LVIDSKSHFLVVWRVKTSMTRNVPVIQHMCIVCKVSDMLTTVLQFFVYFFSSPFDLCLRSIQCNLTQKTMSLIFEKQILEDKLCSGSVWVKRNKASKVAW